MTATWTEIRGNEVYVYVRGRLVMKRWLDTGRSCVFEINPSGVTWNDALVRVPTPT